MPRRLIAVAHFPPPVHGMAAAVDRLVSRLGEAADVRRHNIGAPGLDRSAGYHAVRVGRVLRALAVLALERRRTPEAFFSCDAGAGMLYTLVLTCWARLLGYRMHLQHHSYAYVDRRSRVLAVLVATAGKRCAHLVSCEQMREDFATAYSRARVEVVGISSGFGWGQPRDRPAGPDLVLGFLGNVSIDKGLGLAVETVRAAGRAGTPVRLEVAGPVVDAEADRLLRAAEGDPAIQVIRRGPVYGTDRDDFLDGLDAFLFPSRYVHESFGLVAWEAMARGVPLVAHRSGCLTADAVGGGGVVVDRDTDYVEAAVGVVGRWWRDPAARGAASRAARYRALAVAAAAEEDTARFCRDLVGAGPTGHGRTRES